MKTEEEIRNEIKAIEKTIENYRKAFRSGKIPKDVFDTQIIDSEATIQALEWVWGKNERYD